MDNWATCDSLSSALFKKRPDGLPEQAFAWTQSAHTYTVRFGIGVLMRYYLGEGFRTEFAEWVANMRSEEYYVRMMVAWYFATALAARDENALPYLTDRRLDPWTHRKAIQKAIESSRISPERNQFLRSLR